MELDPFVRLDEWGEPLCFFFRLGSQQVRLNTLANGIAPFPLLWMATATPSKS